MISRDMPQAAAAVPPSMQGRLARALRGGWLALSVAGLAACAHVPPASTAAWQGRLSVTVHDEPPQASSGGFALHGDAREGELQLYSPLGTTVARLQWHANAAQLLRRQEPERYASLDELTAQLTGAALPVAALFDWLQGRATATPGWQVDLSAIAQGRLVARRQQPLPTVTLRIQLDTRE